MPIQLSGEQRRELEALAKAAGLPADQTKRLRLILLIDSGGTYRTIRAELGCGPNFITLWRDRYLEHGTAALLSRTCETPPKRKTKKEVAKPMVKALLADDVQSAKKTLEDKVVAALMGASLDRESACGQASQLACDLYERAEIRLKTLPLTLPKGAKARASAGHSEDDEEL